MIVDYTSKRFKKSTVQVLSSLHVLITYQGKTSCSKIPVKQASNELSKYHYILKIQNQCYNILPGS